MSIRSNIARQLAPRAVDVAPGFSAGFVREALARAIAGVGPLPPATKAAKKALADNDGDQAKAIHDVIERHVRYAGAQGFLTNVGGVVSAAVTIPTNIAGLTVVQCRMVAAIAHLRGYDVDDPRVRTAIMACLVGEAEVQKMVKDKRLPARPSDLATATVADTTLEQRVAREIAVDLISRVVGKRMAVTVGRRVPIAGGFVGAGADGYSTWKIGRYADHELLGPAARKRP